VVFFDAFPFFGEAALASLTFFGPFGGFTAPEAARSL
jgi:hypothetical protein